MKIAVVGAGPAGCASAYRLAEAGHDVTVLEAAAHVGGRTYTWRRDGFVIDTGAFYVCNFYKSTLRLIDQIGLAGQLEEIPRETGLFDADSRWTWTVGSLGSLWRHPPLSLADKLRVSAVFGYHSIGGADPFSTESMARADRGRTVAEWARRAVGENAYETFVRPSFEPWWLFPCDRAAASLCSAFIKTAPGMRLLCLRGGTDSLCTELTRDLDVRLGVTASAVEDRGDHVVIDDDGGGLEADAVIVATDASTAASLLQGQQAAADELGRVQYAAVTHVALAFERGQWADLPYSIHPLRPGVHRAGTVARLSGKLASLVPAGSEVIDVYLKDEASRAAGTEGAVLAAVEEAEAFLGSPLPTPSDVHVFERRKAVVMAGPGHHAAVLRAQNALPHRIRLAGDYCTVSVIEGAVCSGEHAAGQLIGATASEPAARVGAA